jgi:hypothetical protein
MGFEMTETRDAGWPAKLMEIADVAGEEAAMRLSRMYGGRSVYVPGKRIENHPLERLLGQDAFEKLIQHYGGMELRDIPLASALSTKSRMIRSLARAYPDMSNRQIAASARTTERHVRRVLNDENGNGNSEQMNLFDEVLHG